MKWIKAAVFVLCLVPLALLAWRGFNHGLGANPIEYITHSTGWWTLTLLLITLTVTPLRRLSGWNWLLRLRRMLGLYAFFYACLHFTTYIWLDQFFDLASIGKDIVKRPFITVGFTAFVCCCRWRRPPPMPWSSALAPGAGSCCIGWYTSSAYAGSCISGGWSRRTSGSP